MPRGSRRRPTRPTRSGSTPRSGTKSSRQAAAKGKRRASQTPLSETTERRPVGRPTEYDPSCLKAVQALASVGANEYEIAHFLNVTEVTMWKWKAAHPEFVKALEVGEEASKARVGKAVFTRALGFTRIEKRVALSFGVPVEYEVEVYYPPEPGSAKLWLLNKDPEKWREKREVQVYSPEGKAIRTYGMAREELARTYDERVVKAEEASPDPDPHAARDLGRHGREVDESDSDAGVEPLR